MPGITDLAANQLYDPHSQMKFEFFLYGFIHAIIQFMFEHSQGWKPDRITQ